MVQLQVTSFELLVDREEFLRYRRSTLLQTSLSHNSNQAETVISFSLRFGISSLTRYFACQRVSNTSSVTSYLACHRINGISFLTRLACYRVSDVLCVDMNR